MVAESAGSGAARAASFLSRRPRRISVVLGAGAAKNVRIGATCMSLIQATKLAVNGFRSGIANSPACR
jgi:hypothetical protein